MRKSFCLQSVNTFQQINMSPLNKSSSKNLWSFAKDSRFKTPVVYCDNIYSKKSSFINRGTSIGFGNKSDFTKDLTSSPGSSKYKHPTVFDKNKKSKKGFSLYVSREQIPSRGYIPLQPLKFPGPNKYQNCKLDPGLSYSLHDRTKVLDKKMTIESQNNNPGPGKYENPEALSPRGTYMVSKHKGTGATVFNPRKSLRFFQFSIHENQVPGPGKYNQVNQLSDRGHYTLSRTSGSGKRIFDRQRRIAKFQKESRSNFNPGPGSYRIPSDFGQYDGDVYHTSQILRRTKRY